MVKCSLLGSYGMEANGTSALKPLKKANGYANRSAAPRSGSLDRRKGSGDSAHSGLNNNKRVSSHETLSRIAGVE